MTLSLRNEEELLAAVETDTERYYLDELQPAKLKAISFTLRIGRGAAIQSIGQNDRSDCEGNRFRSLTPMAVSLRLTGKPVSRLAVYDRGFLKVGDLITDWSCLGKSEINAHRGSKT